MQPQVITESPSLQFPINSRTLSGEFKFFIRPTFDASGAVLERGFVSSVEFKRSMLVGVMPSALRDLPGEELWDVDLMLQPNSCTIPLTNFELGAQPVVSIPARIFIRHSNGPSGPTTIVMGVGLHPMPLCQSQRDEMWSGIATITPLRIYGGTEHLGGYRADQILCSNEFKDPEGLLKRVFGEAPQ